MRNSSSLNVVLEWVRIIHVSSDVFNLLIVPVIAVFTKCDALHVVAFQRLREQGKGIAEAKALAPKFAEVIFKENGHYGMLQGRRFPPRSYVCLEGE